VFFKIMPAQRLMVDAVANNKEIDPNWGLAAKLRSVHNNYLTLPLLFIMISNHYPMTYQGPNSWLVLMAIGIVSAWIRHYFNLKHIGISRPSILITGALGMFVIAGWISAPTRSDIAPITETAAPAILYEQLTLQQQGVFDLIQTHCANCHSATPTDDMFVIAPMGLTFDDWRQIEARAAVIHRRTVITKDMPLMNKTNMTNEERQILALWFNTLD
jgi:uncharacterized membrane protein